MRLLDDQVLLERNLVVGENRTEGRGSGLKVNITSHSGSIDHCAMGPELGKKLNPSQMIHVSSNISPSVPNVNRSIRGTVCGW